MKLILLLVVFLLLTGCNASHTECDVIVDGEKYHSNGYAQFENGYITIYTNHETLYLSAERVSKNCYRVRETR